MRFIKRSGMGVLWVLAVAVLWVGACDDGGTEPEPNGNGEPDPTTVRVTVTTGGDAESDVTVRLFAEGSEAATETEQTGSDGVASFVDVDAGSYEVEIDVPEGLELDDGETARKSVTVAENATSRVTFELVSPGEEDVVEIRLTADARFDPSEVTISPGTTVRWINDSNTRHTITPRDHDEWRRVSMTQEGDTFTHTFTNTGTFNYFCEPHESQGMTGTITVQE